MSEAISDVLILGGGLAGSAAAITLARAGCRVSLIEKESSAQHKVCGEFLSQEALLYLRELGVNPIELGAEPIHAVRLSGRFGVSEMRLPFPAMSLTRRTLDEELLRLAALAGASLHRGRRARSLVRSVDGWTAVLQDEAGITAQSAFLATGKHDLFGHQRPGGCQSDLIAFKMYFRLTPAQVAELREHVELSLYCGGYGGLLLVEDGIANYCCLVQSKVFQRNGARWETMLETMQQECELLRRRLAGAEALLERPMAISWIPYGFVQCHAEGVWAIGDQAAVIPSFTGDGMSIALHSGRLAAEMFLSGETAETFQARLCRDVRKQVSLAAFISRGLVAEPWCVAMEATARLWPGVLGMVARRTRLPEGAMKPGMQRTIAHRDADSYNSV